MDFKSKKIDKKVLRLTRTVSMEAIFKKNYDHIWKDSNARYTPSNNLDEMEKPDEPAWDKQMSAALAKHNLDAHQQLNLEGASSIILEKLNNMDLNQRSSQKKRAFHLETFFLDDEPSYEKSDDELDDEDDEDDLARKTRKPFGVSYAEGEQALQQLHQWADADMQAMAGTKIKLYHHDFYFLGEEHNMSPETSHDADDPNNEILDAAAWGLEGLDDEDEDEIINNDIPASVASNDVPVENLSADLSPMVEMSALDDEVLPTIEANIETNIEAQITPSEDSRTQNEPTDTSSDIVSVDNLLHKIGLNKAKLDNENDTQTPAQEIAPLIEENALPQIHQPSQKQQDEQAKQEAAQALKALKAQQNAEKKAQQNARNAQQKALKAQENAQKKILKAQKKSIRTS